MKAVILLKIQKLLHHIIRPVRQGTCLEVHAESVGLLAQSVAHEAETAFDPKI